MLNLAIIGLSIGLILSSNTLVNANPIYLSQNNEEIPDIVIDDNPSNPNPQPTTTNNDTRFTCEIYNGQYTVMYHPESQNGEAYPWAVPSKMGGGWSPERRCQAISARLESYRPDGLLELRTGIENGYDILCVTTVDVPQCRIVLTVPIGKNPETVRDQVFDNLISSDNGQQVQGINTYTNNNGINLDNLNLGNLGGLITPQKPSSAINLQPFLSPSDRGTGRFLNNINNSSINNNSSPVKPSQNRQFNPDKFR